MSIRTSNDELKALVRRLMQEQRRQECQIDSSADELRRWKGAAVSLRQETSTMQSQLSLSTITLKDRRKENEALREEISTLQRAKQKLAEEISETEHCSSDMQRGLREMSRHAAEARAVAGRRHDQSNRLQEILERNVQSSTRIQ